VQKALQELRQAAVDRGGNMVSRVRFRSRSHWTTEPQCRRNFNWAWLIFPMFAPVPQSVHVRGEAIYDPPLE
jgi:hypothetical protein